MPYLAHPQIETPPDETVIWRYMDLPKFLFMLEHGTLYFALLSEFEDKWEAVLDRELTAGIANQFTAASGQVIGLFQDYFQHTAVNCWYCGGEESIAMWRLYTKSEFGIAIKSSVRDLKRALTVSDTDVFIGAVVYRDHTTAPAQTLSPYEITPYKAILQKRVCYKHECELRAITHFLSAFADNAQPGTLPDTPYPQRGGPVTVHLSTLIQSITTGPNFPDWAWTLLESALARAGVKSPVIESNAFKPPDARYFEG
jgi:hypothetical protein